MTDALMKNVSWVRGEDTLRGTTAVDSVSGLAKEIATLPNAAMDYDSADGFSIQKDRGAWRAGPVRDARLISNAASVREEGEVKSVHHEAGWEVVLLSPEKDGGKGGW
jgi:hypothetical protein